VIADVVINCHARYLGERSELRAAIADQARRGGARVHETRSLEELGRVAREIAGRGTRAVVLAGGDGSHMAGLTALGHAFGGSPPPIALAPGGTVCTVARNFGMRGSRRAWAERVVRAACSGSARIATRPTLRARDDGGGDRLGFIFGAGLVARFFDAYYAAGAEGIGAAARIAARLFVGSLVNTAEARTVLTPTECALTVDGKPAAPRAWSLVLASVVRDVGLHVRATYRAAEESERFHVVASGLPAHALGWQFPRVLAGRPMRGEPRIDALARSLDITFEAAGAYVFDGDVMRAHSVRVEAGPAIQVLAPPPA
jgi:diacylglycerol kinase (ATP)